MEAKLKDMYNKQFLEDFSKKVCRKYPAFNSSKFVADVMKKSWDDLSLKERMRRISITLGQYLPNHYEAALNVLYSVDESCVGFPYMFFPDFVEVYGQAEEDWELSMSALERFTKGSSSEFAIRPFILKDSDRVMNRMMIWAKNANEHVRRLSSEGCRPRLPWAMALPIFKEDPEKVLNILEELKSDPSIYVRKSVANNLNDISKDNPAAVIDIVKRWRNIHPYTDWILRKGCRTLIRNANPEAMKLFGYAGFEEEKLHVQKASISVSPSKIKIGESCNIKYELHIPNGEPVHIRIEYAIDFVKARGSVSRKLFLLSDKTVAGGKSINGNKTHSFADLTTRRHYVGEHRITLMVNGKEEAYAELQLI